VSVGPAAAHERVLDHLGVQQVVIVEVLPGVNRVSLREVLCLRVLFQGGAISMSKLL
jgi:glycerol-3-phosphate responsive antiterminator